MEEVVPGVLHWSGMYDKIGSPVHSTLLVDAGAAIDPIVPDEATMNELRSAGAPSTVLLASQHHNRHAAQLAESCGATIRASRAAAAEADLGGADVVAFDVGDEVVPGVRALDFGGLFPGEVAYHVAAGPGVLVFADGLIRSEDGQLSFVPEEWMGDDAEGAKARLRENLRAMLDEDFDALAFGHGAPMASGGKAALAAFVA